jgi:hypothetical protein
MNKKSSSKLSKIVFNCLQSRFSIKHVWVSKINTDTGTGYDFGSVSVCITWHIDTLNNDTRQTDTQHNNIWHNNNRHTDTHNNDTPSFQKLSLMASKAGSVLSMCGYQSILIPVSVTIFVQFPFVSTSP